MNRKSAKYTNLDLLDLSSELVDVSSHWSHLVYLPQHAVNPASRVSVRARELLGCCLLPIKLLRSVGEMVLAHLLTVHNSKI